MKRRIAGLLLLVCLLPGCAVLAPEQKQYTATFLGLFDTVTTVVGKAESQAAFQQTAQEIHDGLQVYHQLFDIYNEYPGLNNLKTVNDRAATAPVQVDESIIALLKDCKTYDSATGGKVNAALGSVLSLWHSAREAAYNTPGSACLPEQAALAAAAEHTDLAGVVLDEENSTVFFSDPAVRLDVGAIAKGWAAQRVCEKAPSGLLVSVGGNVCATGPKDEAGTAWVVGIQNPKGGEYLHTLYLTRGSVVTSGDYQRYFTVDGRQYHHIIDPETLQPGRLWSSVTVVCADSGLADALSTALFLLPRDAGQELLDAWDAQAMWVSPEGTLFYSPGFEKLIRT